MAGDCDSDVIASDSLACGRVESSPTGACQIDFAPRMRGSVGEGQVRFISVTADETCRQTKVPTCLHEQCGEVATRSGPLFECLGRTLDAECLASTILQLPGDGFVYLV